MYEEQKSVLRVYSRCVCGYTHSVIAESVFRQLTDLGKQWTFDCSRFSAGLLPSNPNSRDRVAQWVCQHLHSQASRNVPDFLPSTIPNRTWFHQILQLIIPN